MQYRTKIVVDNDGCHSAEVYAAGDPVVPVFVSRPFAGPDARRQAQAKAKWFIDEEKSARVGLFAKQ